MLLFIQPSIASIGVSEDFRQLFFTQNSLLGQLSQGRAVSAWRLSKHNFIWRFPSGSTDRDVDGIRDMTQTFRPALIRMFLQSLAEFHLEISVSSLHTSLGLRVMWPNMNDHHTGQARASSWMTPATNSRPLSDCRIYTWGAKQAERLGKLVSNFSSSF